MSEKSLNHAIVIGSGVAGLLSARVLRDYFQKVTLLERDVLPHKPEPRKTVPQGAHVHALLGRAQVFLERYFPGFISEMKEGGSTIIDTTREFSWFHQGAWRSRHTSGVHMLLSYRPQIDWHLRRRLESDCPEVELREKTSVESYLTSPDKKTVTGVRVKGPNKKSYDLMADLIVDAAGRGSQTPAWLEQMGYQKPHENAVMIDLAYTSRIYERPKNSKEDWGLLVLYPRFPTDWRAGFISHIEDNKWIVSLNGYFGDHAPLDNAGFLEFARTLPTPDIYNRIKDLKPAGKTKIFKIPKSRRFYYDKLSRFPDGLIVVGDANIVFNPIFGQGMTAATVYMEVLDAELKRLVKKNPKNLRGFSKTFHKKVPKLLNLPWLLTTTVDLAYPRTAGKRPPAMGMITWLMSKLLEANSLNPRLQQKFMEVLHLHKGMGNLLQPGFIISLLAYSVKSLFVPLEKRANTKEMPPPAKVDFSTR